MIYALATVAALIILSFGMGIVVCRSILVRLLALEAREIWTRSGVDELGRLVTDLREASAAQSGNTITLQDFDTPGSTSKFSGA